MVDHFFAKKNSKDNLIPRDANFMASEIFLTIFMLSDSLRRQHIQQNRKEMDNGASEYEQMPYRMVIRKAAPHVKYSTNRIQHAASHKQLHPSWSQVSRQRLPGKHNNPAHRNIDKR